MEGRNGVTRAADVAIDSRIVELRYLKTSDGKPVSVICERVDPLRLAFKLGLPGKSLPDLEAEAEAVRAGDETASLRVIDEVAPALIELGTALAGDEPGSFVRPAFYFGAVAPHPQSIPGRRLFAGDRTLLMDAILDLGGHGGGSAAEEEFPGAGDDRGGGADRDGAVALRTGDGDHAEAGPSGS